MLKNFLRGLGSILNIFPEPRECEIKLPEHTDEESLRKDWEAVGQDMYDIKGGS